MRSRCASFGMAKAPFSKPERTSRAGRKAKRPQASSVLRNFNLSLGWSLTCTRGIGLRDSSGKRACWRGCSNMAAFASSKKGLGSKLGTPQKRRRPGSRVFAGCRGAAVDFPTASPSAGRWPQLRGKTSCRPLYLERGTSHSARCWNSLSNVEDMEGSSGDALLVQLPLWRTKSASNISMLSTLTAARPMASLSISGCSFQQSTWGLNLLTASHCLLLRGVPKGGTTAFQGSCTPCRWLSISTQKFSPNFRAASFCKRFAPRRCGSGNGIGMGQRTVGGALSRAQVALEWNQHIFNRVFPRASKENNEFHNLYPCTLEAPAPGTFGPRSAASISLTAMAGPSLTVPSFRFFLLPFPLSCLWCPSPA